MNMGAIFAYTDLLSVFTICLALNQHLTSCLKTTVNLNKTNLATRFWNDGLPRTLSLFRNIILVCFVFLYGYLLKFRLLHIYLKGQVYWSLAIEDNCMKNDKDNVRLSPHSQQKPKQVHLKKVKLSHNK